MNDREALSHGAGCDCSCAHVKEAGADADDPLWENRVLHNASRPDPFDRARLMKPAVLYLQIFPVMRDKARELGYALLIHGSLGKDLDLLAVPWVEDAAEEAVLVQALCEIAGLYNLESVNPPGGKAMPHGRHAYSLLPGGPLFVDLSVMPHQKASASASRVLVDDEPAEPV